MICTTIQNRNLDDILGLLEDDRIQMAEIRLDRCTLEEDDIRTLFSSSDTPLVATCRISGDGKGTWKDAETKLLAAIEVISLTERHHLKPLSKQLKDVPGSAEKL